ncbi:hypothetical protein BC629DRAFT_237044 [Irpex lacteus]|nr:hypothetical protein BC629DRAFT_237044 [Irpex lacteus]
MCIRHRPGYLQDSTQVMDHLETSTVFSSNHANLHKTRYLPRHATGRCIKYSSSLLSLTLITHSNLAAYNLRQAAQYCNGESPRSWQQWASTYNCSNTSSPPAQPTADFGVSLPNWATQALSEGGTFDVEAALRTASGSSKWTTVQIVVPIIVGLTVAVIATVFFFWYRRRNRGSSSRYAKPSRKEGKAWQDSHLRGQRRWFGLLPDRPTVRSRSRRENWSIDEGAVMSPEDMELSGSRLNAPSRTTLNSSYHDRPASGHSRSESATSLLSSPSAKTNTSWISAITNFLPTAKAYQSGVKKEKDYKRVRG